MADGPPLLLGIDVGSSRTKAILMDAAGRSLESSDAPTPFRTGPQGTEAKAAAVLEGVREAVGRLGDARRRVAGIGVAGIAESGVPLDRRGEPLAPIIPWHDRRGEDVADRLSDQFGPELHRLIGQRLRYVATVAKLGWLLDNGVPRPARWLGVPELCVRALTGAEVTEWSLAGRTGCLDICGRSWLSPVAEAAGFDTEVFPPVQSAGDVMGQVSSEASAEFGLPGGVPVTIAGHDHLAGMVGSGADADDLCDSVGTAETVLARSGVVPDVDRAIDRNVTVGIFPGGDGWAVLAGAARYGVAVEEAAAALGKSPADLDRLATGAPLLDAPDLVRSLEDREAPALPDGPPGAVWATLLETLARFTAEATTRVSDVAGSTGRLVVFGGGARSEPSLAFKVRHVPLPVWRSTAAEAVAQGAAVFAGVAAGWWPTPSAAPRPEVEPVSPAGR